MFSHSLPKDECFCHQNRCRVPIGRWRSTTSGGRSIHFFVGASVGLSIFLRYHFPCWHLLRLCMLSFFCMARLICERVDTLSAGIASICNGLLQSLSLVKAADFEPKCLWMVKMRWWRLLSTPDNGTLDASMDRRNKHLLDSLALEPGCPGKPGARALPAHLTILGAADKYDTPTHTHAFLATRWHWSQPVH